MLRVLEDALIKSAAHDMTVRARTPVALYILNQKRGHLRDLELRFGVVITVEADDTLTGSNTHAIERGEPASGGKAEEAAREPEIRPAGYGAAPSDIEDLAIEEEAEAEAAEGGGSEAAEEEIEGGEIEGAEPARGEGEAGEGEQGRRRRRRRRRRGSERASGEGIAADAPQPTDAGLAAMAEIGGDFAAAAPPRAESETGEEEEGRAQGARRRRSRRGRRSERDRFAPPSPEATAAEAEEPAEPSLFPDELAPLSAAEPEAPAPALSSATDRPIAAEPEAPPTAGEPAPAPVGAEDNEPPATASPEAAPSEPAPAGDESSRPRRSGWWQRARATLVGE